MKAKILVFFLFVNTYFAAGQVQNLNQGTGYLLGFNYGINLPAADLGDRFGQHFNAGISNEWLTASKNFIFGIDGQFIFGQKVKTDVLAQLRTAEGHIYGNDKSIADIQLRQRGFYIGAKIGKILLSSDENPRAGLKITLGAGFLQHKIRIQDDPTRTVPQLNEDYKKGYDRLSNGWALSQFIGYQLLSTDKRLNFYIGIEGLQAFTAGRRSFNFDTQSADNSSRVDISYGIKAGWVLPFYFGRAQNEINY